MEINCDWNHDGYKSSESLPTMFLTHVFVPYALLKKSEWRGEQAKMCFYYNIFGP